MTKLLLVNGADVNAEAGHHGTALDAASNGGHDAIVRLLLENGGEWSNFLEHDTERGFKVWQSK